MQYIDQVELENKRILLRVDFNVSLNEKHQLANDARIRQSLPTIEYLLKKNNHLLLLSHLDRPHGRDTQFSLEPIVKRLAEYLPGVTVTLVSDLNSLPRENTRIPTSSEALFVLENIRFFPGEEANDPKFAKELSSVADVFVNDAFSVSHRKSTSVVGLPPLLPSYGGLLLKKEIETIKRVLDNPQSPVVTILGGVKISTKIKLIEKLISLSDIVLLGGGLANTFLLALGFQIGRSLAEREEVHQAKHLLTIAEKKQTRLLLPTDCLVGDLKGQHVEPKLVQSLSGHDQIFDLGPQTIVTYQQAIAQAKTIIWNGPMGLFEVPAYKHGTDAIYEAITTNAQATSLVGGGETLAALSHKHHLDNITHISTGGGAMLAFIENGTLPGIEALEKASH